MRMGAFAVGALCVLVRCMELNLTNKRALVFASSQGIGRGIAEALIGEGARVVLNSSNEERLQAARRQLGAEAYIVKDHSLPNAGAELVAEAVGLLGGLDILVLNGGGPPTGTFEELSLDTWRSAFQDVWMTPVEAVSEALPHMRSQSFGRIILITSLVAKEPLAALTISSSFGAGLLGLINTLAEQLGPSGITVNSIMPGYTDTERLKHVRQDPSSLAQSIPMRRLGTPEELGRFAAFLASEHGGYFTGHAFAYDGGALKGI